MSDPSTVLSAKDVHKTFGSTVALAGASVTIARGEILAIMGPSGSGDSLTGEHVMDLLVNTAREDGATVVLVTHDARVAACADREVIVRDGRASIGAEVVAR